MYIHIYTYISYIHLYIKQIWNSEIYSIDIKINVIDPNPEMCFSTKHQPRILSRDHLQSSCLNLLFHTKSLDPNFETSFKVEIKTMRPWNLDMQNVCDYYTPFWFLEFKRESLRIFGLDTCIPNEQPVVFRWDSHCPLWNWHLKHPLWRSCPCNPFLRNPKSCKKSPGMASTKNAETVPGSPSFHHWLLEAQSSLQPIPPVGPQKTCGFWKAQIMFTHGATLNTHVPGNPFKAPWQPRPLWALLLPLCPQPQPGRHPQQRWRNWLTGVVSSYTNNGNLFGIQLLWNWKLFCRWKAQSSSFSNPFLQLMAEILHQLIGSLSHYLQGFIHPRRCRISAINSRHLAENSAAPTAGAATPLAVAATASTAASPDLSI